MDIENSRKRFQNIKDGVDLILRGIYGNTEWINDKNFQKTPDRVACYMSEFFFEKTHKLEDTIHSLFNVQFPTKGKNMILSPRTKSFSMCPHHLLPVEYDVTVAYLPSENAEKVIGASKLPRLIQMLAKRPILQEDYIEIISNCIKDYLDSTGHGIIVEGTHMCMRCRGVETMSPYVISHMEGTFKTNPSVREEFYTLINYIKGARL